MKLGHVKGGGGGGSASRISNSTGPQDPGGGEAKLSAPGDMAVERPVLHLPSRSAVVLYDGVPAMAVDVTRRRVEGALSTGSECVSMVVEQLRQGDGIRTGSDIPRRGGGMIGVDGTFNLVGGPATAFLSGAEGYTDFDGGVAVAVTPPTVLADEVAVGVTSLAGSFGTRLPDPPCPVVDHMTCWERLEALDEDSSEYYGEIDS